MKKLLSIDEVAVKFGLSTASVNYYTNIGLFVVDRKKGNKRLYDSQETERRIRKVREMLNLGYTLKLIQREFLQSKDFKQF